MEDIERRVFDIELRVAGSDEESPKIVGYGAVFNKMSEDLGGFKEMILPGAFSEAIERDDVRALINHDPNLILGRNQADTLTLSETDNGLKYEIDPPDTSYANDLLESLRRGDISQSSFGFIAEVQEWKDADEDNPLPLRILHRVKLFDVSPVTYPAYSSTVVSVRALEDANHIAARGVDSSADDTARAAARKLGMRRNKLKLLKAK